MRGKSRRSSKFKRTGKYNSQFYRTIKKTGKWRGVKSDDYKTYHKSKTIKEQVDTKTYLERLKKKYGNHNNAFLISLDLKNELRKINKQFNKRPY